jgi:hypothetical protein
MHTRSHLRLLVSLSLGLLVSVVAPLRAATSATPSAVTSLTVTGTNTFNSGSTTNFSSGSTLNVNGALGGTPTGGTLSLLNLTLTLPVAVTWSPTITGTFTATGVFTGGTAGASAHVLNGLDRILTLTSASTSANSLLRFKAGADNKYSIGFNDPGTPQLIFYDDINSAYLGLWNSTGLTITGRLTASGTGAHTFGTTNTIAIAAGAITGTEISDPSAPSTNTGTLYFRDNGSGKTQLVVRFPTGAVQVVATEP